MTDFSINKKNAEQIVMKIMGEQPETRSSDTKLIISVWEAQGLKLKEDQKHMILRLLSPETIRRSRQKIQERGMYLATPEKQQQRALFREETRKYYGH